MAGLLDSLKGMDKATAMGLLQAGAAMMQQRGGSTPQGNLLSVLGDGMGGFGNGYAMTQAHQDELEKQARLEARQSKLDNSNMALQSAQAQHYMNGGSSGDGYHQPIQTSQGWAKWNKETGEYELINLDKGVALPVTADPMLAAQMQNAKEGEKVGNVTMSDGAVVPMQHKQSVPTMQNNGTAADGLMQGLIKTESGGNPNAVSNKGAVGLTQIMPETGRNPGYGVQPLQNDSPEENMRFGRDYLNAMIKANGGDVNKGLSAYNQGQGNLQKNGIINQGYVDSVKHNSGDKIIDASNPVIQAAVMGAKEIAPQMGLHIGQNSAAKKAIEVAGNVSQKTAELQIEAKQKEIDQARKEVKSASRAMDLIKQASEKIPKATGSGIGNQVDELAGYFGIDTKGSTEAAALKSIGANLTASMPRMEGPQSDADRAYYQQMAGSIGDPLVSPAKKKAMLEEIIKIQQRYQQQDVPQQQMQQPQAAQPTHIDDLVGKYL